MKSSKTRKPARAKPKRSVPAPVAQWSPIVRENLPWPIVYYGRLFFAFSESENSPLALCSCAESAVINYFRLHADDFRPMGRNIPIEEETATAEMRQTWAEARPDQASFWLETPVEDLFPGSARRQIPGIHPGRVHYDGSGMGAGAFPHRVVKEFLSNLEDPFGTLRFEPGLCHRCNLATPSLGYSSEIVGRFRQHHGWYIDQTRYRLGLTHGNSLGGVLEDVCPVEIFQLLEEMAPIAYESNIWSTAREAEGNARRAAANPDDMYLGSKAYQDAIDRGRRRVAEANLSDELLIPAREYLREEFLKVEEFREPTYQEVLGQRLRELGSVHGKLSRRVDNMIENITRKEFGFRKIGEGWISESLLHSIIEQIFPGEEILRHHHPSWLNGLELDIYLPKQRLAFEYQGQQHFHAIPVWGGEPALSALKERDARKAEICVDENIRLIAIDYTEALTIEHIQSVLQATS